MLGLVIEYYWVGSLIIIVQTLLWLVDYVVFCMTHPHHINYIADMFERGKVPPQVRNTWVDLVANLVFPTTIIRAWWSWSQGQTMTERWFYQWDSTVRKDKSKY